MTIGDLLQAAAQTLPYWRSGAVSLLALVVLGCVMFAVAVWDE
jgi:hypothetical protein